MSLIVTIQTRNKPVIWQFGPVKIATILMALTALLALPWWLVPTIQSYKWQQQRVEFAIEQQQQNSTRLAATRERLMTHLNQVAANVGKLQSQSERLGILSSKLAEQAGIETTGTEFQQMGGPQAEATQASASKALLAEIASIDALIETYQSSEQQFRLLEKIMTNQQVLDASWLSGRPIESGWLSSSFGKRKDPFTQRTAWHKGVDFAGQSGSKVIATGAGVVTRAEPQSGYGLLVEISHGAGYSTRYGHNAQLEVKVGDVVNKGDVVALMGSTGRSTGPHVHYEVLKNGRQVNPAPFIYRRAP